MEVTNQVQLKFHGVDFPFLNLNSSDSKLKEDNSIIEIKIIPKVYYPIELPNYFKIIQEVKISLENYFEISVTAIGTFELIECTSQELRNIFVNTNAPAIMFPYVRSFISTLTANLGNVTGTLIIPAQFFKGKLEEIKEIK